MGGSPIGLAAPTKARQAGEALHLPRLHAR